MAFTESIFFFLFKKKKKKNWKLKLYQNFDSFFRALELLENCLVMTPSWWQFVFTPVHKKGSSKKNTYD